MIDALIKEAKSWRSMVKLVLIVQREGAEQPEMVAVDLGTARRRWKRVATLIEPLIDDVIGARGYNEAAELVGAWDCPDDDDDDDDQIASPLETTEQAAHRAHTQWCLREATRMHEGVIRLSQELVTATIGIVRELRASVSTSTVIPSNQPSQDDETSKTLGILLQSFMASQNNRSENNEAQRDARRPSGDADGQGFPKQPDEAHQGPA